MAAVLYRETVSYSRSWITILLEPEALQITKIPLLRIPISNITSFGILEKYRHHELTLAYMMPNNTFRAFTFNTNHPVEWREHFRACGITEIEPPI